MKRTSLSRNVMFGFISWLLPLGFTFVLTPFIVHGLGADAYGLYALVMGFVAYSFTFNVGRAATKYIATYHARDQTERAGEVLSTTLFINLIVGSLSALTLALLSNFLVESVLNISPALRAPARISFYLAAVGLLVTTTNQVFSAVPQAVHRFDVYSLVTTCVGILTISGNGVLVLLNFGVPALLAWNVIITGCSCIAFYLASRRLLPKARMTFQFRRDLLVEIVRFSSGVVAYQILSNMFVLFERIWLTRTLGSASLTWYVVPMTIAIYMHAFIFSLTLVIFPLASEANTKADVDGLRLIYQRACKYVSLLILFMTITLSVGSREILTNWMGESFSQNAARVLAVQAIVFGLIALGSISWQMSEGLGRPGRNAWLVLSWIVIGVPAMIHLTPIWGVNGMAYGRLASVMPILIYIPLTERLMFGRGLWKFWGRNGSILGIAGLATIGLQMFMYHNLQEGWFWLLLTIGVSGTLYLMVLWIAGYLDQDERTWLRQYATRVTSSFRGREFDEKLI